MIVGWRPRLPPRVWEITLCRTVWFNHHNTLLETPSTFPEPLSWQPPANQPSHCTVSTLSVFEHLCVILMILYLHTVLFFFFAFFFFLHLCTYLVHISIILGHVLCLHRICTHLMSYSRKMPNLHQLIFNLDAEETSCEHNINMISHIQTISTSL